MPSHLVLLVTLECARRQVPTSALANSAIVPTRTLPNLVKESPLATNAIPRANAPVRINQDPAASTVAPAAGAAGEAVDDAE